MYCQRISTTQNTRIRPSVRCARVNCGSVRDDVEPELRAHDCVCVCARSAWEELILSTHSATHHLCVFIQYLIEKLWFSPVDSVRSSLNAPQHNYESTSSSAAIITLILDIYFLCFPSAEFGRCQCMVSMDGSRPMIESISYTRPSS